MGTLGRILAHTAERVAALLPHAGELERAAARAPQPPSFAAALAGASVAVIAEAKRCSPSRGTLNSTLDVPQQLRAYEQGGAAAASVLTEPDHFGGRPEDLAEARAAVRLPILRKDFVVHPLQVAESRALGASAVLLIARALGGTALRDLHAEAAAHSLDALVEVRSERELERALEAGARVIGVNARDLETLTVDPGVVERVLPRVPADRVAVWESGVSTADDVRRAAAAGADAVLVGSALSAAPRPAEVLAALLGIPRIGPRG